MLELSGSVTVSPADVRRGLEANGVRLRFAHSWFLSTGSEGILFPVWHAAQLLHIWTSLVSLSWTDINSIWTIWLRVSVLQPAS